MSAPAASPDDAGAFPDEDDEPVCARCGSAMFWEDCWNCGGEGELDVYELDPLWYDEGDTETCDICRGKGGFYICLNRECKGEDHVAPCHASQD